MCLLLIRVIHIIDPRPCCCWSQKRPQGQRGLSCWCHSPALLHSRTDRESGGSCRGWFAAPARRAAPRALDIAQRTRDHGRRDRHGEWAAAAKVGWGCSATARRRSWPRAAAAAIKSYILDKSTNSYVYVIKDRFYVHMCIVGAKARQENVVVSQFKLDSNTISNTLPHFVKYTWELVHIIVYSFSVSTMFFLFSNSHVLTISYYDT